MVEPLPLILSFNAIYMHSPVKKLKLPNRTSNIEWRVKKCYGKHAQSISIDLKQVHENTCNNRPRYWENPNALSLSLYLSFIPIGSPVEYDWSSLSS